MEEPDTPRPTRLTPSVAVNVVAVLGNLVSGVVCGIVAFFGRFMGMLPATCQPEAAARCHTIAEWVIAVASVGLPLVWLASLAVTWTSRRWRALWAWLPVPVAVGVFLISVQVEQYARSLGQ